MSELSIIVPVYNAEESIIKCVESIKKQTLRDIAVILVNDGSTDNSGEICDKLSEGDDRVTVIHKRNGGVSRARNLGIDMANTKYIMFVDSDDYISEDMCQSLLTSIKKTKADMSICGFKQKFTRDDKILYTRDVSPECGDILDNHSFNLQYGQLYSKTILISPCFKVYNLHIIKKNNIKFNEEISLGEDMLFNQCFLTISRKISVVNRCLYNYVYEDKDTLSKNYATNRLKVVEYLFEESIEFCEKINIWDINKENIIDLYLRSCMICLETCLSAKCTSQEFFSNITSITYSKNTKKAYLELHNSGIKNPYAFLFKTRNKYIIACASWLRWKIKRVIRNRKI